MSTHALARWVEIVSWSFALLGALLPFAFHTSVFALYREALSIWACGSAVVPPADAQLLTLMLGILGGSITGKWIVHALIARGPLAEGRAWARRATLAGLALWFVVDSAASLALGATFNVWMINLMPLLLVGIPLAFAADKFRNAVAPFDPNLGAMVEPSSTIARACLWTSILGAGTGLGIAFGGTTVLFALWFQGLEAAQYAGLPLPDDTHRLALFFFGPIGGCTIAQFAMLALWLRAERGTSRVALAGVASILAWFAIDSAYGLANNGLFNIALVNVPAALMTLPAWLLLRSRRRRSDS